MFELLFKRYAPFTSFGGGFHGDGRTGPSITGSARTWGQVNFTLSAITSNSAWSSPTYHTSFPTYRVVGTPRITISKLRTAPNSISFTAHTEGANPMVDGSPDIDTFLDISVRSSGPRMTVTARMRGDDFPSGEAYLTHPRGTRMLMHFATPHGALEGPITRLFGAHDKQTLARCTVVL